MLRRTTLLDCLGAATLFTENWNKIMPRPIPQNSTMGEEGGQCVLLGRSINRILSVDLERRQ